MHRDTSDDKVRYLRCAKVTRLVGVEEIHAAMLGRNLPKGKQPGKQSFTDPKALPTALTRSVARDAEGCLALIRGIRDGE